MNVSEHINKEDARSKTRKGMLKDVGAIPTEDDTLPEVHGWYLTTIPPKDPYMDPSLGVGILCGEKVFGHPNIEDGEPISTTPLLYLIGKEAGKAYAKTLNRWYRLIMPQDGYVKFIEQGGNKLWFSEGVYQNHNRRF